MNVRQLREAIKDLDGDMPVNAWTNDDTEFEVRIATVYERAPLIKPRLSLGNDPNEFSSANEKMLYEDAPAECPDCGEENCERNH